jgi:hypothetical protein
MSKDVFVPLQPLNTAVLFLVFNRLETTKQVFETIRLAKPPRLYIAADGARADREDESEKVEAVRRHILQAIDWECEVKTLFRDTNLGCKYAVSGGITWFFESEEQGIILEDDCLPSQSFFWFCENMLERYKVDQRIFLVSGYNKQKEWKAEKNSFFFSNFGGIWGWASWKRAWDNYDIEMRDIDRFIEENHFVNLLGKKLGLLRQNAIYDNIKVHNVNTWDYQWGYSRHKNNALSCVPSKSLIENIGFGDDATHTTVGSDDVKRLDIEFPIKDNFMMIPDRDYDDLFLTSSIRQKITQKLRRLVGKA